MGTDNLIAEKQPSSKRQQTKEANRQAILDAARDVFAELGYGATTVRDIIRRTGLASGTFYNYFKSKEEVFEALNDRAALKLRPHLLEVRKNARTFEEFIRETCKAYFAYVGTDRESYAMARRNAGTMRFRIDSPEVIAGFEELREDLAAAVESGLAPKLDVDYMTAAMVGTAFEMADVMLTRDPIDYDRAAEFAARLLMGGIEALKGFEEDV